MTPEQEGKVATLLNILCPTQVHQGDCIGADAQFVDLAFDEMLQGLEVHCHPPTNNKHRAFADCHTLHPTKGYLERNKDIVKAADIMIACPKEDGEVVRSGTWSTIRYAEAQGVLTIIVYTDGRTGSEIMCNLGGIS